MILTSSTFFATGIVAVFPQNDAGGAPELAAAATSATCRSAGAAVAGLPMGLLQRCCTEPVQVAMSSRAAVLPLGSVRQRPDFGLTSSPLDFLVQIWAAVRLHAYQSTSVPLAVPAPATSRQPPSARRVRSE